MKTTLIATFGALASVTAAVNANPGIVYNDATGDIDPNITTGNGTLDLVSMEVSNTSTDIQFQLTVNGNIGTTDWGKFMIGMSTGNPGTTSGNGWGRPINMSSTAGGMDFWVGSWVNGGGAAQLWNYTTGSWNGPAAPGGFAFAAGAQSTITYTLSLASLGLNNGDTFFFDAYSSGGGGTDGAIDALANPNVSITSWDGSYTSTGVNIFSYTVVPAPGALALLGVAGLIGARKRR